MRTDYIIPLKALSHYKKRAKRLQRASGRAHHELLDEIAQKIGLPNWHHLMQHADATALCETAFKRGFVLGLDIKVASEHWNGDENFVHDDRLSYFCAPVVEAFLLSEWEREDGLLSKEDREEAKRLSLDGYGYFRYVGPALPTSLDDAIGLAMEFAFFDPDLLWLRGEFHPR